MSNKPEKKQTGKVNYIWVLAGGYLIYLAYKLFRGVMSGDAGQTPLIGIASGVLFVLVGAYLLHREWKAYKYGMEHIDDPDSWSDEEEDEELAQLMEASKESVAEESSVDGNETDDAQEEEE